MPDFFEALRPSIDMTFDPKRSVPIAVVGAGSIVEFAHLPAYRDIGLDVRGIFDLDRNRAERLARDFGISRVYSTLEEVAADDEIEVVDVAVFPWDQPAVAELLLAAGKHLLCQKPLAMSASEAAGIAELAQRHGRIVGVNQQLRYDEGVAAAKAMMDAGWIGDVTTVTFDVHVWTPWEDWAWVADQEHLDLRFHTIHYLDAARHLLGDPSWVWGTQTREPGQKLLGETRSMSVLGYPDDVRALLHVYHRNSDGDPRAEFRIDGARGSIRGTLGLLYDYPTGRRDSLQVFSSEVGTDGWLPYPVTRRWIPDAFAGPMVALLEAIGAGTSHPTGAAENLGTLRLIEALYRSNEQCSTVHLAELKGA